MTVRRSHPWTVHRLTGVLLALLAATPTGIGATEVGATHLVYEKPVKMKKIAALLYLSFPDQTAKRDSPQRPRQVDCAVAVTGTKRPLTATGSLALTLLDEGGAGSSWRSAELSVALDRDGEARFAAADIASILSEAPTAGAGVDLIEIAYAGGKGKKVAKLTIDCLRAPETD